MNPYKKQDLEQDRNQIDITAVIDNTDDIIVIRDTDGRVLLGNNAFKRITHKLFGIEIKPGMRTTDYLPADIKQYWEDILSKVNKGEQVREEFSYAFGDEEIRHYDIFLNPVIVDGIIVGSSEVNRDITERKQIEEALRRSEEKYRHLFEGLQEGIWVIDKDAYTTFVNQPMADMLGYTRDEMVGRHLFEFIDHESINDAKARLEKHSREIKEQHEFEFIKKNGDKIFTLLQTTSLFEGRHYTGALASVIDISKLNQARYELLQGMERYRQLFENMSNGVAVYEAIDNGEDFVFRDFNRAAEKIEQIRRDDILGKRVTEAFPGVKDFGMFDILQNVWKSGHAEYFEPHLYKDDREPGTWREAWVYKLPGGEVVAIYNDITERKQAENALKNSQELLSEMTRRIPGVIYQFYSRPDGDMGFYYVSKGSEQAFGLKADTDDFFERFTETVIPEHREAFIKSIQKAAEEISPWHFEGMAQTQTGEPFYFSAHSTPSVRETEVVFNGVVLDITVTKKVEEERRKLQAQLLQSEKMASIGQLAAGVAHEINNPTGFVSSNLNTLNDYQNDITALLKEYQELVSIMKDPSNEDKISDATKDKLSDIAELEKKIDIEFIMEDFRALIKDCREGTDRIKKIVIDLKDFAHPGEDSPQLTDINKSIESTLNVLWSEIKYHANVKKNLGQLPLVMCYPHQLNQVFMNIIINAAQAIGDKGEITITTIDNHQDVIIQIQDTGCGIKKEHLAKIFDPFFTTKEVGKGTGLGMNVAYNIVKNHNGRIEVTSTVGKGTLFTIHIPVNSDD